MRKSTLATVFVGSSMVLFAGDWPGYRGADHNGISTEKDWLGAWPSGQPATVWKKNVGTGFATVAVAGGRAYTVGNKGDKDTVFCLKADTGEEVWHYTYQEPLTPKYYEGGPSATPTIANGAVYGISKSGHAWCLDAATGALKWETQLAAEHGIKAPEWGFAGSPLVRDGKVILNVGDHGLALAADTGKIVWSTGSAAAGYGSPVPFSEGGKSLLAVFGAKEVAAVDPESGAVAWTYPWKTSYEVNSADPVVSGDLMFVSSGYGTGGGVLKLGGGKPTQVWFNKEIRSHFQTAVVMNGRIFGVDGQGGDKDSKLKCLELATGKVVWTSPNASTGTVIAAGDRLLWLTGGGELVVVDAKASEYKEVARAQVTSGLCWTAPVLANGKVYLRNAKGDVVCVDLKGAGPLI
jgi:outer membrane protein assembly factor BamB